MVMDMESEIERLVGALTLDEKASLTAGASMWYLPAVERLGLRALKMSDGPSGVRGDSLIGRRSLSLPCGMAVGSTWNPDLVRALGDVLAAEARSKGVHVVLGPTVCIVRTPLAGRTFESFSEDPLLTARIAGAYIEGVQAGGVACCIKHYACNDQEHERMTISAEVDERALREIHLVAFEHAVQEAGVWSLMTAYNKVNGVYCGEQPELIDGVLRREWGFDGLVVSDWFGTHSTGAAARAGLDLEMPGPSAWLGPSLAAAVRDGQVDESTVDGQVRHVLRLMGRVGILGGGSDAPPGEKEEDDPGRCGVARRVAAEGTVLLVNDGVLPLDPADASVRSVAVIGPNAAQLAMGGGSSEVTPHRRRRVDEALAERLPGASVVSEVGCRIDRGLPAIDLRLLADETLRIDYFDNADLAGAPVATESAHTARVLWIGPVRPELAIGRCSVRLSTTFVPDVSGAWRLGLESAGRSVLRLDGDVVVDNSEPVRGSGFYGAGSEPVEVTLDLAAGRSYALTVEVWPRSSSSPIMGARIGASPPDTGDEFERAVAAAAEADVAVVVVGSNAQWESEGHDRPDLSLPGRQRELVEAVLEANRRTVVVVNAGSPVEMPWASRAGAVLMTWYPGEEGADALADMLVGLAEPSGRLPVTFPARVEDGPAGLGVEGDRYPGVEGKVVYGEGVLVGYRFYETTRLAPLFPFGFGLSYGDVAFDDVQVDADVVTVTLVNNGSRQGTEVVQVYVRAPESLVRRPDRELAGFTKVVLEAGARSTVRVPLGARALRYWDVDTHAWRTDPGRYEVLVGTSSRDIRASAEIIWGDVSPS